MILFKKILPIFFCALTGAFQFYLQTQGRTFEPIITEKGLSQSSEDAFWQDSYGIIWFGAKAELMNRNEYCFSFTGFIIIRESY